MNPTFQHFRDIKSTQNKAIEKAKLIGNLGKALEEAIEGRLDEMELRHTEILDQILGLHLSLMYETHPELEPKKEDSSPSE